MRKPLGLALAAILAAPAAQAGAAEWTTGRTVPGSVGVGFPYDADLGGRARLAVAMVSRGVRVVVRDRARGWGDAELLSSARAAATAPDVEVTGRGEVVVAWTQSSSRRLPVSGPNAIHVAVRSPRGRWSSWIVGGTRHFIAAEPRVAVNARGDAAVIWRGWPRRRGPDRLLAAFRPAGRAFGRAVSLRETGIDQRLAVDDSGRVVAMWTRTLPPEHLRSQVRFASRAAGAWSRPETVADGRVGGPELALVGDGSVVAAWRAAERGLGATRSGEAVAAVRAAAGTWGPAQPLSAVRTKAIHLGASEAGEVIATFNHAPPVFPEPERFALHLTARPPGGAFGPVTVTPGLADGPLAVLADGTAVTLFGQRGMQASTRPPGGAFGAPVRLSRTGDLPVVSAWGDDAAAVWTVFGPDRLRFATFEAG